MQGGGKKGDEVQEDGHPEEHAMTYFFLIFLSFWRTHVLFGRPLVPLFWISGYFSSRFQNLEWVLSYSLFFGGNCNVHSPRSTSGATRNAMAC